MNPLVKLNSMGQSIWYDNIERNMLGDGGALAQLIAEDDLRGVTSNPAIYEKALSQTTDYDGAIDTLKATGLSSRELFFKLAVEDIQQACDLFLPTYKKTSGVDGYVSLEVSPDLAYDAMGTIAEAKKLWCDINRPNAMIKVPATREGIEAIETLTAAGININVTLIFSVERYHEVADAYIRGLKVRLANGEKIDHIASVASFFISRIDSKVDPLVMESLPELRGKIAIANAKKAYKTYEKKFEIGSIFQALSEQGANPQRLLWASTSVKDPDYSETLYIDTLIGEKTVNTVPPSTYQAYKAKGNPQFTLKEGFDKAEEMLVTLANEGISLEAICQDLETEGIAQFEQAFASLLSVIEQKLK